MLGQYYLSWVVVLCKSASKEGYLDSSKSDYLVNKEKLTKEISSILKQGLFSLCQGYLNAPLNNQMIDFSHPELTHLLNLDFDAVAIEMVFFASGEYIPYVVKGDFPKEIFGKKTTISFPSFPSDEEMAQMRIFELSRALPTGWGILLIRGDKETQIEHLGWMLSLAKFKENKEKFEKLIQFLLEMSSPIIL
jgi:hypothetical protein